MISAQLDKQLMITVNNEVGTLAEVTSVVATSGINLIAMCAHAIDDQGTIMFVTESNKQAKKLLKKKGYEVREEEVILLSLHNKPGALQSVTQKIAVAGIDLTLIYGSVDKNADISRIVIITENNDTALMAIKLSADA